MKNRLGFLILYLLSSLIIIVNVEAADISYPEENVGMLYGYTPGSFLSTDSPTDLAIDGNGFFILRDSKSENVFYTKVGIFDFDSNDYLVSSHGYIVQGWEVTEEGEAVGAVKDIQIHSTYRSSISIDKNGKIFEQDSHDTLIPLYQITISQVGDPHRLEEIEDNLFQETSDSGAPTINFPGAGGMGTIENYSLEEIDPDFSYETDIWVDGDGFFVVSEQGDENLIYYTLFDAFRLNNNGQMVSSGDLVAQGWKLVTDDIIGETETNGALTDIKFQSSTIPPEPSDHITVVVNIDADSFDHSVGINALSLAWNGSLDLTIPIASSAYEHHATASVYDYLGNTHEITIYIDKADTDQSVEFIVTCAPSEDMRFASDPDTDAGHGLLGRGTINFTVDGGFDNMTFERLVSSNPVAGGAWESQDVSTDLSNQYFTLVVDFLGVADAAIDTEVDFGAEYNGSTWIPDESSTTFNIAPSSTVLISSNGYGAQTLARVLIDEEGVITAYYSEGLVLPCFQIALATFEDVSALNEIDPDLFEETSESGSPTVFPPAENGFGSLVFVEPEDDEPEDDEPENDSNRNGGCFINSVLF